MAKYEIAHACGHIVRHDIVGKMDARDREIEYERGRDCRACYEKARNEARQAESAAAAEKAAAENLPRLTGSDKQVAWAETIRGAALAAIRAADAKVGAVAATDLTPEGQLAYRAAVDVMLGEVTAQADARWWIDGRTTNWQAALLARVRPVVQEHRVQKA